MKEPWCLATTLHDRKATDVVTLYGKRFTIRRPSATRRTCGWDGPIGDAHPHTNRRDRLLLLAAIAQALLTLLGAAGGNAASTAC
jgi:hypothetical protein